MCCGKVQRMYSKSRSDAGVVTIEVAETVNQAPVINMMQTSAKDEDPVKEGIQVREGSVMNMSGMASDKDGDALTWEWIYKVGGGEDVVYESGVGRGGVVSVDTGGWSGKVEWIFRVSDGVNEVEKRLF